MPHVLTRFFVASVLTAAASSQCPSLGVTVAAAGGRLGDAWRVEAVGPPAAIGVFGLDLAGGPVPTPLGTICLGFTPNLQTLAFFFDGGGHGQIGGLMPPNPVFEGITIHATAVAFAPSLPGGIGIGNGDRFTLRQPRFWCVSPGVSSPFGTTPGTIAAVNAIAENVVFSQGLASSVVDAATASERGLLVLRLGNGALEAYDGSGPAPLWSVTLGGSAASSTNMLAVTPDLMLLLSPGTPPSPFSAGSPGTVHTVALANGAVLASFPMAAGNPDAMLQVPGTPLVVLRLASGVVQFDWSTGVFSPALPLPTTNGALVDWQVASGLLYVLHAGTTPGPFGGSSTPPAVSVVSTGALTVLWTNALAMTAPASMLRAGPGSAGPALYVYGSAAASLQELSQVLAQPMATIAAGSSIAAMELSPLGTQWLLLCAGAGCGGPSLLQLPVGTTTLTPLVLLGATPSSLAASPSAGYGKACLAQGAAASPFGCDPFTSLGSVLLPATSTGWRILVD